MPQSGNFEYSRFATLLPALAAVVLRRENSPVRMAADGARLGGLLAWGVEQARFSLELTGPEITDACKSQRFRSVQPVPGLGFAVDAEIGQHSAMTRFKAVGEAGDPLELLVSNPAAAKAIIADGRIALKLVKLIHSRPRRMSATDLASLLNLLALMAAGEADLAEEADGLRIGAGSNLFSAPRVVTQCDEFLLETALPGCQAEDLPGTRRMSAYSNVVLNWARMLTQDGILHTFLRRDQIRFHQEKIGVTRWAGAYYPGPAVQAFVPSLARAAFGDNAAVRARERSSLLGLLAYGLGITGSLEDLVDFCLALVSQGGPLQVARPFMPGLLICEQVPATPDRMGLTRLLRQLVWFRDLGQACGAEDLSLPWRQLAQEV